MHKTFHNGGHAKWQQDREKWRTTTNQRKKDPARAVDVDVIVEHIFTQHGRKNLPAPVPLPQMVDLLIDFWEADGLYD